MTYELKSLTKNHLSYKKKVKKRIIDLLGNGIGPCGSFGGWVTPQVLVGSMKEFANGNNPGNFINL